jgi:type II secretory pathway component PulM
MTSSEKIGVALASWMKLHPRLAAMIVWSVLLAILAGGIWAIYDRISDGKILSTILLIVILSLGAFARKAASE